MVDRTLRIDELTGTQVILAPGRAAAAPVDRWSGLPEIATRCPFCPGNEPDTDETIALWPSDQWRVRVVANRYPLVVGNHEVLVESREHDGDLATFAPDQLQAIARMYRDRARVLAARPGVASVGVFRNRGRRSGSSQPHPHGQLVALPVAPIDVQHRSERDRRFRASHGAPLLDTIVARTLEERVRVVAESSRFVVYCPHAPRFVHETHIAPRHAAPSFDAFDDDAIDELALLLGDAARRLSVVTRGADYNVIVRQPALGEVGPVYVELLPRRAVGAGFELTTGMAIITIAPEDTAAALRSA